MCWVLPIRSLLFFFSIKYCFVPHEIFTVHKIENRIDKYLHFQIKHFIDYGASFPMDCFPKYRGHSSTIQNLPLHCAPTVRLCSFTLL